MPSDSPPGAQRRVEVVDVSEPPDDLPFDLSIEVSDPWITQESTATLSVSIQNTGEDPRMFDQAFKKGRSDALGRKGIFLFSTNTPEAPSEEYAPPCLRGASPSDYERRIIGPLAASDLRRKEARSSSSSRGSHGPIRCS